MENKKTGNSKLSLIKFESEGGNSQWPRGRTFARSLGSNPAYSLQFLDFEEQLEIKQIKIQYIPEVCKKGQKYKSVV